MTTWHTLLFDAGTAAEDGTATVHVDKDGRSSFNLQRSLASTGPGSDTSSEVMNQTGSESYTQSKDSSKTYLMPGSAGSYADTGLVQSNETHHGTQDFVTTQTSLGQDGGLDLMAATLTVTVDLVQHGHETFTLTSSGWDLKSATTPDTLAPNGQSASASTLSSFVLTKSGGSDSEMAQGSTTVDGRSYASASVMEQAGGESVTMSMKTVERADGMYPVAGLTPNPLNMTGEDSASVQSLQTTVVDKQSDGSFALHQEGVSGAALAGGSTAVPEGDALLLVGDDGTLVSMGRANRASTRRARKPTPSPTTAGRPRARRRRVRRC